jgi:hypothetical protein
MGFCSALTLAFASIFSLVSVALLAIAFATDNWHTITVRRDKIKVSSVQFVLKNTLLFRTRVSFSDCNDLVGGRLHTRYLFLRFFLLTHVKNFCTIS